MWLPAGVRLVSSARFPISARSRARDSVNTCRVSVGEGLVGEVFSRWWTVSQ